ncbi:MAG: substrate-binding domain-containing protein [Oscillospiraceae bacterium]
MKKAISLLLCLVLALSLAACSKPSGDKETEKTEDKPTVNAPKYDFSKVEVQKFDANYPNGAVYYSDIAEIINTVYVPQKPIKVGFVMKTLVNEYWSTVKTGIEDEVARLKKEGFDVTVDIQAGASDGDKEGQLAILRNMINQKYDMIVICPISDANLTPGIEEAIAANIPIVTMNTYFDGEPYVDYYIGASFFSQGQMAAKWIADNNPKGGEVAVIMGLADATSSIGCTDGFTKWIESNPESGLKIVDVQSADWDRVRAQDVTATLLKQNPNLVAIFCNNDVMALGSVEAVKQANMLKQVMVVGRDGTSEGVTSIKNKELAASIGQFPFYMGKTSLQMAILALDGVDVPDRVWIANAMIDQSNCNNDQGEVIGWKEINYEALK